VRSRAGLVTTVGWSLNGETTYALEGSVFNAGSAIQWLRDELQVISTSHECDILAESVPDSGGIGDVGDTARDSATAPPSLFRLPLIPLSAIITKLCFPCTRSPG